MAISNGKTASSLYYNGPLTINHSRGPNNLYAYMYEPQQNLERGMRACKTGLSPRPVYLLLVVPKRCFCCGLF